MVTLKKKIRAIILFSLFFVLASCSKIQYLINQGKGQNELLNSARKNEDVLKDQSVSEDFKKKIRKIIELKKYYYDFWEEEQSEIYSKTAFLKDQAVSYLVIASPFDKIEPKEECFPFFGCFPYLGFFKESLAKEYAKDLEEDGYVVYIRPVMAYSTLGYFDDPILSSMLILDEYDLAETVFHELFHTTLFIKNEVSLNEALADLVGQEMSEIYYSFEKTSKEKRELKRNKSRNLEKWLVAKTQKLNNIYGYHKNLEPFQAKGILDSFVKNEFTIEAQKKCKGFKFSEDECFPLKIKWNNAAFTSFLTYEEEDERLFKLKKDLNLNLRDFVGLIKLRYKDYNNSDRETRLKGFPDFLFQKVENYASYTIHQSPRNPSN
jgi:predicted aminopeptidase